MKAEQYLAMIHMAEQLKNNTRHCYTSNGHHETVAEHSWRLTFMAFFIRDEFPEADGDKLIKMCLLHDMGEAFTGDIPCFEKNENHEEIERMRINQWIETMPDFYQKEVKKLFDEMDQLQTVEAKIFKALDNMEAVIQHDESDIKTWLPLEYDLQFTYGKDKVAFSEYLKEFKALIDEETKQKIENSKKQ